MAGRRIVLTGATRGLGRAMVDRFIEAGCTVVGCGRSAAGVAKLKQIHPAPHRFDVVDVTDLAATEAWAQSVLEEGGPPDLLVNNAAVINTPAVLWEVPPEEFRTLFDVNVTGVYHVIRAFAPAMTARKKGTIVNFSSTWGKTTSPEVAPYCATKFAIEGLTAALAQELPAGMAAVSLNPGVIDTDMLRQCFGAGAGAYPSPQEWSRKAAAQILAISSTDNGRHVAIR